MGAHPANAVTGMTQATNNRTTHRVQRHQTGCGILLLCLALGLPEAAGADFTVAPPGGGNAPIDTNGPNGAAIQAGDGMETAGNGIYRNILEIKDKDNGSNNSGDVRGYNYDGAANPLPFDQGNSPGFPEYLYLGELPIITIGTTRYVGFALDSQEKGNDDYISVDEFRIYLNTDREVLVRNEDAAEGTLNIDGGELGTLVYDMDGDEDNTLLVNLYASSSGKSDLRIYVPMQNFLDVGGTGSETVYLWTVQGRRGVDGGLDYGDNGNTEQWSVLGLRDPNDDSNLPSYSEVLVPEPSTWVGGVCALFALMGHFVWRRRSDGSALQGK